MKRRQYILDNLRQIGIYSSELSAETNFIIQNLFGTSDIYCDTDISEEDIFKINEIIEKRKIGIPLQYILSVADFMGEKFFVNKNVLIPRPETEILVRKTAEIAQNFTQPKILDIGSGSGCIAIILSKILKSKVFSCDISEDALLVARQNSKNLNANVDFIHSDLFENINDKFDIIASNPPYIPPKEKTTIQKEVSFEPDLALYTKDDSGIEFYEKIISQSGKYLKHKGYLLFELGINQFEIVKKLFMDYNFSDIEIINDLDNIERVILARNNNE